MTAEEIQKSFGSDEKLARFILHRSHLRSDRTVKPDAFIPFPYPDLSVTRHVQLSEAELWNIGRDVAWQTGKTLRGRADMHAFIFKQHKLRVIAAPTVTNPNHANVIEWPSEKSAQKHIAQQIAAAVGRAREVPPASD